MGEIYVALPSIVATHDWRINLVKEISRAPRNNFLPQHTTDEGPFNHTVVAKAGTVSTLQ